MSAIGDQVIYQLGNPIVLLDIHRRQVALIGNGHHPVVALPTTRPDERRKLCAEPAADSK